MFSIWNFLFHRIQKGKKIIFSDKIRMVFLFWIYNLVEPFSAKIFFMCLFVWSSENSMYEWKTAKFVLVLWMFMLNLSSFDRFDDRQIELKKSCVLRGPYLYWIFMNIPNRMAKLISSVNCQQLTFNCAFFSCFILLVCVLLKCLCFSVEKNSLILPLLSIYRSHFRMKMNLNKSRGIFFRRSDTTK